MTGYSRGIGRKVGLVVGIGIDIIKASRFENLLETKTSSFAERLCKRILHPTKELPRFKEMSPQRRVQFLTGSWAAKEALFKTLQVHEQGEFNFNEWYRFNDTNGKPFIWNDKYNSNDEEFHLSISHDDSIVIATVLRQKIYDFETKT
ncbi:hypothetical protein CANMA_002208 [Candida margitis]|uniref:uncharacterized protein n=1 Tax=Candida margitis TaxID=1775924 RepID=UPI0022265BCC|nr:uncharacterized protein CANMA_002208 [Candida margitis]KAI5968772.1 hypothetical protein CANMA_002208 [Candida margitis]